MTFCFPLRFCFENSVSSTEKKNPKTFDSNPQQRHRNIIIQRKRSKTKRSNEKRSSIGHPKFFVISFYIAKKKRKKEEKENEKEKEESSSPNPEQSRSKRCALQCLKVFHGDRWLDHEAIKHTVCLEHLACEHSLAHTMARLNKSLSDPRNLIVVAI